MDTMSQVLKNFNRYRYLLGELAKKNIKLKYRRSYLGILWTLIEPLLTMMVLSFVFEEMLGRELELNVVDGLIMPNLKMQEKDGKCIFLQDDNRCSVHDMRPGICRMFPLGRYWEDNTHFKYIVQKGECNKDNLSKIKLKKWLGIEGLAAYDRFVILWHQYIKQLQSELSGLDDEQIRILNTFNLRLFYITPYAECRDESSFYQEFDKRVATAREKLGL